MRFKETLKITSVSMAMLILAFTLNGIRKEDLWKTQAGKVEGSLLENMEKPVIPDMEVENIPFEVLTADEPEITEPEPVVSLSAMDEEILMKIAMSEAEGESVEGKALVMLSVLNRVRSGEFPDTIPEVIFQDTQYSPVLDGRYYSTIPDDDCLVALELVENGWDESLGAMYFENYGADSWHSGNLEFLFQEGSHRFYR